MTSTTRLVLFLILLAPILAAQEIDPTTVLEALASERVVTRREILTSAAPWQEPRLVARLVELAAADEDPIVRGRALARLAPARAEHRALFRRIAEEDEALAPRLEAIRLLGFVAGADDRDFLLRLLAGRGQPAAAAAMALAEDGAKEAFDPMVRLLARSGDDAWLGPALPRALVRIDAERALPVLIDALVLPDSPRLWVAMAIAETEAREVLPRALALLAHEDAEIRRLAAAIVGKLGDESCHDALLAALAGHPAERSHYIAALGDLGSPRAIPVLLASLENDEEAIDRRAAARALSRILPEGESERLERRLGSEKDAQVVVVLCEILACLGDRRSVGALVALLDDDRISAQPRRISSIRPYPWNVAVREAAGHAILSLRDEESPGPRAELAAFPADRAERPWSQTARAWWQEVAEPGPWMRRVARSGAER